MLPTFRDPRLQDVQAVLETDMTTSPGLAEVGQGRGRPCEDPSQVDQIQRDIAEPATPPQCRRSPIHEHVVARAILA